MKIKVVAKRRYGDSAPRILLLKLRWRLGVTLLSLLLVSSFCTC